MDVYTKVCMVYIQVSSYFAQKTKWMTDNEIYKRIKLAENLSGMTINERLYACSLFAEFDKSMLSDKVTAEKILTFLSVDKESIELILKSK